MDGEYFQALYTSMIYRRKKVKSFKEGFVKRSNQKIVLFDDRKVRIESTFNSNNLEEGLEIEFDENYCEVAGRENLVAARAMAVTSATSTRPPVKRMGLTRSNGLKVRMKTKEDIPLVVPPQDPQPPVQPFAKCTNPKRPKITGTRRLELNDVSENVPKSDQELLALFMSEDNALPEEQIPKNHSESHNRPLTATRTANPSSLVPTFKDFDNSASSSDDYEEVRPKPNNTLPTNTHLVAAQNRFVSSRNILVSNSNESIAPSSSKPTGIQKRFTPVSKNSVINPTKKFKAPVRISKLKSGRPNKFNFCFQLPLSDQGNKLLREMSIPNTFSNASQYKSCLTGCLTETINLELQSLCLKFSKTLQKSKSNLEPAMRSQRIPFYSNVCLSESQSLDFGMGFNRSSNVSLAIDNKEHHSQYSKDDIWLVSNSSDMVDSEFFRSYYYGPSGSNVEVFYNY